MTSAPPSQPKESFHLIPIGETGTGKTTLINSFANYSRYATLDEAIENGPVVLANVGFTYNAAGVREPVYLRGSTNGIEEEADVSGVTHTQGSSVYSIVSNDSEELIFYDNPGFGSQSLLQEETIKKPTHAICIVLKPDETRLHTELRTFLQTEGKSLVKNIVYCFTNTRAHFFQPAATLTTLRDFLSDFEGTVGVEFPIKQENIFCFENDCFRYLCHLVANHRDQSRHHDLYAREWATNVEEYKRLINRVKTLTPILHEEVKKPGICMERTNFRDLLPILKEVISVESQEVQQAFEVFMKSVDTSGDHASIRSPELSSEQTLAVKLVQLDAVNETDNAKKEDTKDESKFPISDIADLHIAVRQGNEKLVHSLDSIAEMVKSLLQHGAIVNSINTDLSTALHTAAGQGNNLMMEMFIKVGASVTLRDANSMTPLHIAAEGNHIECARTLLNHRAPIDAVESLGQTPLYSAARNGHTNMVKLLLEENANPNASDRHGLTPLDFACSKGAFYCVTYLLERGASPNMTTDDDRTALYFATHGNHADVVKILIQYGANVDARCSDDQSALHIASLKGNVDIVTLLLQAGANPNSATTDNKTPLQIARENGHNELATILMKHGAR